MKKDPPNPRFTCRFLLVFMLMPASVSSADPAEESCRRGRAFLTQQAQNEQRISIAKSVGVAVDDTGASQRTIELRWSAFSEDFVVTLKDLPKSEEEIPADSSPLTRELFPGDWMGHKAELVLFWRWPSGAWEGDLKQGRKLYSIRVPCEQRATGSDAFEPSIFLVEYPVEPGA